MRLRWAAAAALSACTWTGASSQEVGNVGCDTYEYIPNFFGDFARKNPLGPCSGNGVCVNNRCVCNQGWTGRSDIINTEGLDCQIHLDTVRYLWITTLVVSCLSFAYGLPPTVKMFLSFDRMRKRKSEMGLKVRIRENFGLLANLMYLFVCFPMLIGVCSVKIALPEERLGVTPFVTTLFAICKMGLYLAMFFYHPALFHSILRGEPRLQHITLFARQSNAVITIIAAMMGFLPFLCFLSEDPTGPINLTVWFILIGTTSLQLILLLFLVLWIYREVFRILDGAFLLTNSASISETKKRLMIVRRDSVAQCVIQGLIYTTFTFYPFLFNKHDYLLPVGWLGYSIIGAKISIFAFSTPNKDSSINNDQTFRSSDRFQPSNLSRLAVPTAFSNPTMTFDEE